jgi:hypothetical protein
MKFQTKEVNMGIEPKKTLDLGFPMVRFNKDRNWIEFMTPVECDHNGCFKRDAQFILIHTQESIDELRDALNELWPNKVEEILSNKIKDDIRTAIYMDEPDKTYKLRKIIGEK